MSKKEKQLMFKIKKGKAEIVEARGVKRAELDTVSARPEPVPKTSGAGWFRLDNAATIYPSSVKENWNFVFRVACVLKTKVRPDVLQQALDDIMPRFPTFDVYLKAGLFWNYFEHNPNQLKVERETNFPCSCMKLGGKSHCVRVLYSDFKIAVEVFHAITDGRGATTFLNSLLARYFELQGEAITYTGAVLNYLDLPAPEELEDSFFENATDEKASSHKEQVAYNIRGTILDEGIVNTTTGTLSVKEIKEIAKKHNCKLTTFLAAVLCQVIIKKRKNSKKPVKISIPIDLRPWFDSKTLRNFSSYINIAICDENAGLEAIISTISAEIAKIDRKYLEKNINSNVNLQKNWFIKLMPLCIKKGVMNLSYNLLGERLQTFAFSNIGRVDAPPEFEKLIDHYEVNLGRSKHNAIAVGLISFGDKLSVTISSKLSEPITERDFFKELASLGASVYIESNRRDLYGGKNL